MQRVVPAMDGIFPVLKIFGACLVISAVIILAKSEYRIAQAQIH
jgi:hypothetical protein